MAFASYAAERGHQVTLFEAADELGGQLNLAKQVPGKEEFFETLRYFCRRLELAKVDVKLNMRASIEELKAFNEVVLATGVLPRLPEIPGIDHAKVISYPDLLSGRKKAGSKVAIIGAGGIGFDVAEYLVQEGEKPDIGVYLKAWGVDEKEGPRGGLQASPEPPKPGRAVFLCQRKSDRMGASLGKTTGRVHRATLKANKVKMIGGVTYQRIDDQVRIAKRRRPAAWKWIPSSIVRPAQQRNW